MPTLCIDAHLLTYVSEGEGFPLLLVPDRQGTIADWGHTIPLLGELCKVIAYEPQKPAQVSGATQVAMLLAVLEALNIPKAYMAGYASGALTALYCAQYASDRLEGLLLVSAEHAAQPPPRPASMAADVTAPLALPALSIPTCLFTGAASLTHLEHADRLMAQLPRCTHVLIPGAAAAPHRDQPLPLGHAMLEFLSHCERQRHLVRGASFLL